MLVFVVLGGIGNIRGSVIAAAALTLLPELLRSFSTHRMLVYAIVLILVMLATNSPLLKRFLSWLGSVKSLKDIGQGMTNTVKTARSGMLQARARMLGGMAGGLSGLATWLEKRQHALESKANSIMKNDGKAGDVQ